jgi:hypothetical protein
MSRGRKPSRDAKRKNIIVRFQEGEYNAIKEYAKRLDIPFSTFVRDVVLKHLESQNVPTSIAIDDPNQLTIDTGE